MRLSIKLSEIYGISRRNAKKYITEGKVRLNGRVTKKDAEITDAEKIEADFTFAAYEHDNTDLLISRTDEVIFFYKPPFMHSERHTPEDPQTIGDIVPEGYKLISRLDYETDGIIAAAAENYAVKHMEKTYLAAVEGGFPDEIFMDNRIDAAKRRKVKVLDKKGGNAVRFKLREKRCNMSIVEAKLEKANRHQLRAFLSYLGFPIIGDRLYGGREFPRLMLHCEQTEINDAFEASGKSDNFISYLFANL